MVHLIEQRPPAACHRLEIDDDDVRAVDAAEHARMLLLIHLIRAFEIAVLELKDADLVHGPVHASIGQEAVAAGTAVALRSTDKVASTHRAHGHFLAKALTCYAPNGYDPRHTAFTPPMQEAVDRTLAEIMGLQEGWCGGRGGSMHLYDAASGNLGSNAIVGGGIPIASGAAWAQRLQGRDAVVVSFFGDGAVNQGCFHEVANMAALWGAPVLYLIENNLYAVGTGTDESSYVQDLAQRTVGCGLDGLIVDGMDPVAVYTAVRRAAHDMRRRPFPTVIEAKTYRFYHHGGGLIGSAYGYRSKDEEARWQGRDPVHAYPAALALLGLVDSQEDERLQEMARAAVAHAVERCTREQNGRRTIPAALWPPVESAAENNRSEMRDISSLRSSAPVPDIAPPYREREDFERWTPLKYVEAIAAVTRRSMERDERVVVLGEEVANLNGGAYSATRGIVEAFPGRLINTPISETGFVGMAGGLAAAGMRPVVEVMFPDFALMASDQLFNQIGKLRHMYGGQVCFPLVVRTRVATGFGYGGQHSMDPGGFFALFSGWRIVAPATPFDYIGLFNTAVDLQDPVLVIDHGKLYAESGPVPLHGEAPDLDYRVPYGRARVVRPGRDVTVLTYLTGVGQCTQAAEALAAEGLEAEVIDLRTLDYTGMDWAAIGASVRKTGSVLVVEQGPRSMTLGARIADEIQGRFFDYLDGPVGHVTALDVPPPVSRALEEAVLPSPAQIQAAMARGARHAF